MDMVCYAIVGALFVKQEHGLLEWDTLALKLMVADGELVGVRTLLLLKKLLTVLCCFNTLTMYAHTLRRSVPTGSCCASASRSS